MYSGGFWTSTTLKLHVKLSEFNPDLRWMSLIDVEFGSCWY
jgi:hypothetical protein